MNQRKSPKNLPVNHESRVTILEGVQGNACIKKTGFGIAGLIHFSAEVAAGKGVAARDGALIQTKSESRKLYQGADRGQDSLAGASG